MKNTLKFSTGSLFLIAFLLIASCNEGEVLDIDVLNSNYYPVKEGSTWIYQLDSIIYDDEGFTITETSSMMKETLSELTLNAAGDSIYVLEIAKRKDSLSEWVLTDLWTLEQNELFVKRTEENLNFVKLVFPPLLGTKWIGNQFDETTEVLIAGDIILMYENWDYEILDNPKTFNTTLDNYTEVLVVQQADSGNLIRRRFSREYYAKDIGLVKKDMMILDLICSTDCMEEIPWGEKGSQGFILTQTLIEYLP